MQLELGKEYLERLGRAVEEQDVAFIQATLADEHAADVAEVLDELPIHQGKYILDQLERPLVGEVFSLLTVEVRKDFLEVFDSTELADIITWMDSDDAVDLLDSLPIRQREEIIALIPDEETANNIVELLHYDPSCAGGIMAKELIKANIDWDITQTIEEIRRQAENVEKIFSVYVVDDMGRLLGKVGVKRMLLARQGSKIRDIYDDEVIAVESYREVAEVAELMQKYDLEAIPVINIQNKLLGRITIDDVVDLITEKAEKDQQLMAGISADVEEDDSIFKSAKARLPWLLIGMCGGIAGAEFIGLFEEDLRLLPAMAFFIPLITATGGNVGIQSSTVIVQSLSSQSLMGTQYGATLLRTLGIALINAVVISSAVLTLVSLLGEPLSLGLVVAAALFSVVILASVMGTITPLVLDRIGINPALASGPFITTANDLLGLLVYFSVARALSGLI